MRALVLLMGLLLSGLGPDLYAQSRRPLPPVHWSHDFLEALRGMGVPGGELVLVRDRSGTGALEGFETALAGSSPEASPALQALLDTWAGRLRGELGRSTDQGAGDLGGYLLEGEAGWSDLPALPFRARGGYGRALLAGDPLPGVTLWGEALVSTDGGGEAVRSGGVALPLGSFDLFVGRVPAALGQGRESFLLNGRVPVDGASLTSRTPFRLPGSLSRMGEFRFHAAFSPFISSPLTSSAWLGSFALAWSPHPRVDLAVLRTTRFAGKDIEPFDVEKFFRMLAWQGQNDAFDDSQGEVAARVRWGLGGQPLVTYLSLGFEDRDSAYEDPGLLMGAQLPLLLPAGLLTVGYEFLAYGHRALWCGSCEYEHHAWYLSPKFGAYFLEGDFLGAALGGYGASHRGRLEAWLSRAPVRGWVEYLSLVRNTNNVLLDPSLVREVAPREVESWTVGFDAFLGERWGLAGSIQSATLDGERTTGGTAAIRILAGG